MRRSLWGTVAAIVGVWLVAVPATGQTPAATPKTQAAGKKAWTPARTPDGQPDIQGIWEGGAGFQEQGFARPDVRPGPAGDVNCKVGTGVNSACAAYVQIFTGYVNGRANFGSGPSEENPTGRARGFIDVPNGKLPWTPGGAAKRQDILDHFYDPPSLQYLDSAVRCMPQGLPRGGPGEYQFLQIPGSVVLLQEFNHVSRIIPVDGRPHLGPDIRRFIGDSVGHWDGTTLVVDTTNFIGGGWYDLVGTPWSDALHMIERFKIVDANTIDYTVTVDDPKLFTKPWSFGGSFGRVVKAPGVQTIELLENACAEGGSSARTQPGEAEQTAATAGE